MIKIPLEKYPRVVETVNLDGVLYTLEFTWNDRFSYWVVSVRNSFNELLISEIKVVHGFDFFKRYARKTLPQGLMIFLRDKLEPPIQKISFDETGLNLYYIEESEIVAI